MARQAVHSFLLVLLPFVLVLLTWAVRAFAAPPDYGRLSLKGDGHAQDHFSLSVQAAARLLGRDLDYETLYVLSTNAFAPCFDPAENCAAWWATATGRDTCADLIGRRLGLRFRRLPGPDGRGAPPMPEEGPARARWLAEYYRKLAVTAIRAAQSQGDAGPDAQ
jgi:hypothetical protein